MTNARLFVVEWENPEGTAGGSFPLMLDPLATPTEIAQEAHGSFKAFGHPGSVKAITEYAPAAPKQPKTLTTARTRYVYDGTYFVYDMEVIGDDNRGTGVWVVLKAESDLGIGATRRVLIELPAEVL